MSGEIDLGIDGIGPATLIGQGGSGRVYRAQQPHLDRDVAVKIVPTGDDPAILRRFDREQRAMGRLSSVDGILPVHEAGQTTSGDLYLITPYMPAGSLQHWMHEYGNIPWETAVEASLHVANALEGAHRLGIVHRDIKPGNVLLDAASRPLIADFGIARLHGGHTATSAELSLTPAYAAPETFETNEGTVATDIYSLGAMLWALIAGRTPFTDADDATPLSVLIGRVISQPIGDLRHLAPSAVCDVIERATAKDPTQRYQSAADFAMALRAARDGAPAPAAAPPPTTAPTISTAPITTSVPISGPTSGPTDAPPPVTPPTGPPQAPVPAAGGSSRWWVAVVGLLLVGGIGAGVWFVTQSGDDGDTEAGGQPTPTVADEEAPTATPEEDVPTPTPVEDEPTPTPEEEEEEPTPTVRPPRIESPLVIAVEWLTEDAQTIADTGTEPVVGPCPSPGAAATHCSYPTVSVPVGSVVVFGDRTGTPEVSVLVNGQDEGLGVGEVYRESDPPNPFDRPLWLNDAHGEDDIVDAYVADRGFSDPIRPSVPCLPTTSAVVGRTLLSSGSTLNVRRTPGNSDEGVILELGPDFTVTVYADVTEQALGRDWFMVELPIPDEITDPTERGLWRCGWAAADFLEVNSPTEGVGQARCLVGDTLIFGGTTAEGRFDVAICDTGPGGVQYRGAERGTPNSIRLDGCVTDTGRYRADNGATRYVVDDTIFPPTLTVRVNGTVEYEDDIVGITRGVAAPFDPC